MTLMFKIFFWLSRRIPGFGRLMWAIYSCEIPRRTKIGGVLHSYIMQKA